MTREELTNELKTKSIALTKLLEDPQPGLSTWVMMVGDALDSIAVYAPSYVKVKEL